MFIKNGLVLQNKKFVLADIEFHEKIEKIGSLQSEKYLDAANCYVVPSFIDIHTHGAVDEDFSDGKAEAIQSMMNYYADRGVTSVLATTMTLKESDLKKAMYAIKDFQKNSGAKIAGIHLGGPFLCAAKKGASHATHLYNGMPDGDYLLGGQTVELKGEAAYLKNTNTLAGSAIPLYDGVKNAIAFELSPEAAFYAATTAPAKAARLENIGSLEIGKWADILILDKNLNLKYVFVNGESQLQQNKNISEIAQNKA